MGEVRSTLGCCGARGAEELVARNGQRSRSRDAPQGAARGMFLDFHEIQTTATTSGLQNP
jgi:hypothetical protein